MSESALIYNEHVTIFTHFSESMIINKVFAAHIGAEVDGAHVTPRLRTLCHYRKDSSILTAFCHPRCRFINAEFPRGMVWPPLWASIVVPRCVSLLQRPHPHNCYSLSSLQQDHVHMPGVPGSSPRASSLGTLCTVHGTKWTQSAPVHVCVFSKPQIKNGRNLKCEKISSVLNI